ncbi:MAG: DUF6531 domain-containing protein, partial [Candidatus Methylomirabilales bacterium]
MAAAVGSGILTSAKLRLTIVLNGNNWGASGRDVAVHRMNQAWSEIGATWKCSDDLNTQNSAPDCAGAEWEMTNSSLWPFVATPTALALHEKTQTGPVEWDVTADVAAFLAGTATNYGWIVKKVEEGQSGKVEYSSREGVAPPELLINATSAAALVGVDPATGTQGETLTVTLTGSNTSFDGTTEATFGRNIQVGGGPEGDFGAVAVTNTTSATASLAISATAALGPRTVTARTNTEQVSKADAFAVLAPGPVAISETSVTTIAGTGTAGFTDGQGTAAQFDSPGGIARDAAGNLYVADTNNHSIRKIAPDGTVTTLAGSGTPGLADGTGTTAQFDSPQGVAVDSSGAVYVADTANHVIRQIASTGTVTTLAGTGVAGFGDGPGSTAQFDRPRSIALRSDGILIVGDEGNSRVRLVDPVTGQVSTLAGSGTPGFLDGTATVAQFASLAGVASDSAGNVLVADSDNQRIRKIAASDGTVSTFAGTGGFGFADGAAASAQFADPSGVTVDSAGNVYVADSFNSLIRRITPAGQVDTVAGTGVRGADDGDGTTATFRTPQALVTGSQVFIADTGNHLIRLLQIGPIITGIDPTSGVQDSTFTLTVTGTNLGGATALTFLNGGTADITATNLSVDPSGTTLTASVDIVSIAALGARVVTVTTPGGTSSDTPTAANTFTVLGKLTLTPDPFSVKQGETAPLTVSIENPAPTGGIEVTLESAGPTIATVTSPETIAEGATSTTATVTGVTEAITNITASATGFADAIVGVNVTAPVPTITSFDPGAGEVGDAVTITGTGFRTTPTDNTVTFTGPNDTRVSTPVTSATSTQLVVTVPAGAVTGPLEVTTAGGTATSTGHFIVLATPDFTLSAQPETGTMVAGDQISIHLTATGDGGFTGLIDLSVGTLPTGISATLSPDQIAPGGSSTLIVQSSVAGTLAISVTGTANLNGQPTSKSVSVSLSVLSATTTALTGRILRTDDVPLENVLITLLDAQDQPTTITATTDAGGNFVLTGAIPAGQQMFFVDARQARASPTDTNQYPPVEAVLDVTTNQANRVPHIIYLPAIDTAAVTATPPGNASPIIATSANIPDLEVEIPAGTTIQLTELDGTTSTVTEITLTAVPVDRAPMPLPAGVSTPFLLTVQPGGAVPQNSAGGMIVRYPTWGSGVPGQKADLYFFDFTARDWVIYGTGTVSPDGRQVIPDINPSTGQPFAQPRFAWGFPVVRPPPLQELDVNLISLETAPGGTTGGEPVDLATGFFTLSKTDMVLPGRLPIALTRTYRSSDNQVGSFGIGGRAPFNPFLVFPTTSATDQLILVLPNLTRFAFSRQPDDTFVNTNDPAMRGAVVTLDGSNRVLTFKDQTVWTFDGDGRLIAQQDRNGNTLTITRDGQGRATAIIEPAGRNLTLTYVGTSLRIASITDPLGRTVTYTYDANNRLTSVTDPAGEVTSYTYDAQDQL